MPVESKYVARRSGPFAALMHAPELAGLVLEPLHPVSVRDGYFDTPSGDLLRQGYVLRVRAQGETAVATLKRLDKAEGGRPRPREAEATLPLPPDGAALPPLPAGPLRDALDWLVGAAPLGPLLRLGQYRAPRAVYDGGRLVGVLSLDVVGYELPRGLHVSNEAEVELGEDGREDDLFRLAPALRERGLEPTARSKFERGLLHLQRGPGHPLRLLPDERRALERLQEAADPLHRRRARVVLLAAKGYRPETISNKAGLSPTRVEHWVQRFREGRLDVFEATETETERQQAPAFRVSELVGAGAPPSSPPFEPDPFAAGDPPPKPAPTAGLPDAPHALLVSEETVERERDPREAVPLTPFGDGAPDGAPAAPTLPAARAEEAAPEDAGEREDAMSAGSPTPIPPPTRTPIARPRLRPEDPVLHAGARVLRHQHDRLADAVARLLGAPPDGAADADVRRALLAAHRVRIAIELFADFLPERPARWFHGGLREPVRALDALADLDLARGHLVQTRDAAPPEERAALDAPLRALDQQRGAAWERVALWLGSASCLRWTQRFERLLDGLDAQAAAGLLVGDHAREEWDDFVGEIEGRPRRARLRHTLASSLWSRCEGLRAYEAVVDEADDEALRPLGVGCAALQFALGLAADAAPQPARDAARTLDGMETALAALHRARLTADALVPSAGDPALDPLRAAGREARTRARAEVGAAWEALSGPAFRERLAAVAAAL